MLTLFSTGSIACDIIDATSFTTCTEDNISFLAAKESKAIAANGFSSKRNDAKSDKRPPLIIFCRQQLTAIGLENSHAHHLLEQRPEHSRRFAFEEIDTACPSFCATADDPFLSTDANFSLRIYRRESAMFRNWQVFVSFCRENIYMGNCCGGHLQKRDSNFCFKLTSREQRNAVRIGDLHLIKKMQFFLYQFAASELTSIQIRKSWIPF